MSSLVNKYNSDRIDLAKKNTKRTSRRRINLGNKILNKVIKPQPNNPDLKKYTPDSSLVLSQGGLAPYRGNYSKQLHHDADGFVISADYTKLLSALVSPDSKKKWNNIYTQGKLVDPQASLYATTCGYDSKSIVTDGPTPSFTSQEGGTELVELYCMSGCRDVTFNNYTLLNINILNSINFLNTQPVLSYYSGPVNTSGNVDITNIFRGSSLGDKYGPYISQFLWLPVPEFNLNYISQQLYPSPVSVDYLKTFTNWLNNQNNGTPDPSGPLTFNSPRYIASGRDLSNVVHYDDNLTWGHKIAQILYYGLKCPISNYNPYKTSSTQVGFVNFGIVDLCAILGEVTKYAMLSAWYVKWNNALKLRPEEYAHRLHMAKTNPTYSFLTNDLPTNLQNSNAPLTYANSLYGTYLLSQAYPEGSPAHPSFPSGHAVFAGATATILKVWFNSDTTINSLTNYHSSITGLPVNIVAPTFTTLTQYTGSDTGSMTVATELDKFATNISMGRNFAGIHYRTDAEEGILLGESVAIRFLKDRIKLYPSSLNFKKWKLRKRNGEIIYIS